LARATLSPHPATADPAVALPTVGIKPFFARGSRNRLIKAVGLAIGAVVIAIGVANAIIWNAARGHVVDNAAELSGTYDAVIVPGARVWADERPSLTLRSRIDAATNLYELGIVDHILASGDNGNAGYDEPTIIRRRAHQQDVPLADITLDYAGFSTWQTCVRAREIFRVERAVFVTQARYADRAAALCEAAGIDVDVLSLGGPGRFSLSLGWRSVVREPLAAVKGAYEMIVRPDPQFLGDRIGLVGSEAPANPDPVLGEE